MRGDIRCWLGLAGAIAGALSMQTRQAPVVEVAIQTNLKFGQSPLQLEDVKLSTSAGNTVSITRLSFLMSEFELLRSDGKVIKIPDQFGWISASDRRTRFRLSDVPVGEYTQISFKVGLPPKVNHSDPANYGAEHPLNPVLNNLHWSWAGGYVFLAIEGRYEQPGARLGGYSFHLGKDENLSKVTLNGDFNITIGSEFRLNFDARTLFKGLPVTTGKDTSHSAQGDPIASQIRSNIPQAFSLISVTTEAHSAEPEAEVKKIPAGTTAFELKIPSHFPRPALPADNPLTIEGVALGKMLFMEPKLSRGNKQSCMSCHEPTRAFVDPDKPLSLGVDGKTGNRNSMPLFNLAWSPSFTWDGRRTKLRDQALAPIQDEREMHQSLEVTVKKLGADRDYPRRFREAFGSDGITAERIGLAIEQFLLTLVSGDAKFDRFIKKQLNLSAQEKRGFDLFIGEFNPARGQRGADCFHCHGGNLFTDFTFKNNGLARQGNDFGREIVTGRRFDRDKFKVPSLRNVALTAPYMHDGRFKTLEQVVDHYDRGFHRSDSLDPNMAKHPTGGLKLTTADKQALVAFMKALTESSWLPQGATAR